MFGRILLTSASVVALTASALGADLGGGSPYVAAAAAPYWNWTGFYVGADVGGAWGSGSVNGVVPPTSAMISSARTLEAAIDHGSFSDSAVFGGGQIGYNIQSGSFVFGAEASLDDLNTSTKRDTGLVTDGSHIGRTNDELSVGRLFTVRGKVGYAFDRALLYFTGGWAGVDRSFSHAQSWNFLTGAPLLAAGSSSVIPAASKIRSRLTL